MKVFYLLPVVPYVKLSIVVVNILALDLHVYNYNCIEIFFTIWSHVILFAVVVAILDFNPINIFVQFGFNMFGVLLNSSVDSEKLILKHFPECLVLISVMQSQTHWIYQLC